MDYGFRALIAPSFSDIFQRNCIVNGLLPVQLPESEVFKLLDFVRQDPECCQLEVNLETGQIRFLGVIQDPIAFSMKANERDQLLLGLDAVDLTLSRIGDEIAAFEARDQVLRPWLHEEKNVH